MVKHLLIFSFLMGANLRSNEVDDIAALMRGVPNLQYLGKDICVGVFGSPNDDALANLLIAKFEKLGLNAHEGKNCGSEVSMTIADVGVIITDSKDGEGKKGLLSLYSLTFKMRKGVIQTGKKTYVLPVIWENSICGFVANDRVEETIRRTMDSILDDFEDDYLKATLKKEKAPLKND